MATTFDHQDAEYHQWIDHHQHGFVVNAYRNLNPIYLQLHRASCHTISGTPACGRTWTEGEFVKVCSDSLQDIQLWARRNTEGTLNPCYFCKPE